VTTLLKGFYDETFFEYYDLDASCEMVVCALSGLKEKFEVNVGPHKVQVSAIEKQLGTFTSSS
jgi:hypothetical protein